MRKHSFLGNIGPRLEKGGGTLSFHSVIPQKEAKKNFELKK
jgi:hypothetical protein